MKLIPVILLGAVLAVQAETEESIQKTFKVQPGAILFVDVDFGSIEVTTNAGSQVHVQVFRKITRRSKTEEETFLKERPVTFSEEAGGVVIRSKSSKPRTAGWNWGWGQKMEGKYTISVPSSFNLDLKTSGGSIGVSQVSGDTKANTSGGGLRFTGLKGPLDGRTSGGSIKVVDCQGELKIHTSGGGIDVSGGKGGLVGETSGGSVQVKNFNGPATVKTSGGGITIDGVSGKVVGNTSGGSINASFPSPPADDLQLKTSGGGVTVALPATSAFELDASTSGGSVQSDLSVTTSGKPSRSKLAGPVNGGGKMVHLRSSGGSIRVKKI